MYVIYKINTVTNFPPEKLKNKIIDILYNSSNLRFFLFNFNSHSFRMCSKFWCIHALN